MFVKYETLPSLMNFLPTIERNVEEKKNSYYPSITIKKSDSDVFITAEVPGTFKEDVKVTIKNNLLTISGERKLPEKLKDAKFICKKLFYGTFERTIKLPFTVNENTVSAEYKNGVVYITVSKNEDTKPKEISIR